jgi:hypothetical protein
MYDLNVVKVSVIYNVWPLTINSSALRKSQ